MHPDFAKLFSDISTDGAGRTERWVGIEAYAGTYEQARIEVLARLAFATKPPAGGHQQEDLSTALAAFRTALSEADPSIEHGVRQDQILAAGALLQLFGSRSTAAMVVTTTSCGGARKLSLPIDLVVAAENALSSLAAARRTRPDLSKAKLDVVDFEFEPDLNEAQPNQPLTFKPAFDQVATAVDEALSDLTNRFNASIEKLISANKKADEELDMLSWVFGEQSLLPAAHFADIAADQRPLVLARDLASLTTIYPGPNSVPALLSRAGVKTTGKIKIADAVNAVADDWTDAVVKNRKPSPATSPVHFALAKRQETGAGDGWLAGWSAITGIDAATAMSPMDLAVQFYREILWLR